MPDKFNHIENRLVLAHKFFESLPDKDMRYLKFSTRSSLPESIKDYHKGHAPLTKIEEQVFGKRFKRCFAYEAPREFDKFEIDDALGTINWFFDAGMNLQQKLAIGAVIPLRAKGYGYKWTTAQKALGWWHLNAKSVKYHYFKGLGVIDEFEKQRKAK